jgi:hypothetical protein
MEMAVIDIRPLSIGRYLLQYALIHVVFLATILLHFSLNDVAVRYLTLILIAGFALLFYIRPDYVLPIYGIHRRLMAESGVVSADSAVAYLAKRVTIWIFVVTWFPLFAIFSGRLMPVAKIYILLICVFLTFYFSNFLFNNYETYVFKKEKGEWMKLKRHWIPKG